MQRNTWRLQNEHNMQEMIKITILIIRMMMIVIQTHHKNKYNKRTNTNEITESTSTTRIMRQREQREATRRGRASLTSRLNPAGTESLGTAKPGTIPVNSIPKKAKHIQHLSFIQTKQKNTVSKQQAVLFGFSKEILM